MWHCGRTRIIGTVDEFHEWRKIYREVSDYDEIDKEHGTLQCNDKPSQETFQSCILYIKIG